MLLPSGYVGSLVTLLLLPCLSRPQILGRLHASCELHCSRLLGCLRTASLVLAAFLRVGFCGRKIDGWDVEVLQGALGLGVLVSKAVREHDMIHLEPS